MDGLAQAAIMKVMKRPPTTEQAIALAAIPNGRRKN
jgi:hypothetical protein